jgi:hypothetical protein
MPRRGTASRKQLPHMLLCMSLVVLFTACTKQPEPIHVSGTVTFRGQPVPKGLILIHPDRQQGNSGPFGIATIQDGKFDTKEMKGRGAMPGRVKFAITGYENVGVAEDYSDAPSLFPPFAVNKEIGPDATVIEIVVP